MKIVKVFPLPVAVLLSLFSTPAVMAAQTSTSNDGLIQRLMVGSAKSCQLPGMNSEIKAPSKGKGLVVEVEAQKVIDKLIAKNTSASIEAANLLKASLNNFISTKASINSTYLNSINTAQATCNAGIVILKKNYDLAISQGKGDGKPSKTSAQKGKPVIPQTAAANTFKVGALASISTFEKALKDSAMAQKSALLALETQLSTATQTAQTKLS